MDFNSFLLSLATSFSAFVALVLLFTWLSRKPDNYVVYYPNRILKGMDPFENGSKTRHPFAWILEVLTSTEQDVINMSGVDAAVYFIFLGTVLGILTLSGVILLPVLLPLAATDDGIKKSKINGNFNQIDNLSMANITKASPRLWAFLVATYWVSVVTYYVSWRAYVRVSSLRAQALMSMEVKPEQFAVLVRDVPSPKNQTKKEFVDSYFTKIYPDSFYRSLVVAENSKVNKIWEELEGYKKKLAQAEAVYAKSNNRPTSKSGFLGLLGERVESIEYYTQKINETTLKLEAEQKVTLCEKQQNAALVFFNNRVTAASAAQSLHCQKDDKWTVIHAPESRQLIWKNLNIKFFERRVRQYIVYFIVALTILFYMIPIAFVSGITTLENLEEAFGFVKTIAKIAPLGDILEAYLPQTALILFLALLPKLLLFLSKAEGIPSESHAIRAASNKYFYFTVLNVFIGVGVGGTLFGTMKKIKEEPKSIISILAMSLPKSANFFLTYVALNFFVGYGLELSRLVPLIIFHLKKKFLCQTEADVKEAWFPGDLSYATRVPRDMLIITITFCYSVIAPLIIPFGILYFGLGWLILRNQALKVYVPSYESYGRMWPRIFIRILASLLLFQLTMFGYFGIKGFAYTVFLVPLIVITLIFAYICYKKFYRAFQHMALDVVCCDLKETPDLEQIFRSYIPPSLSSVKPDDYEFEGALSRYEGTGSWAV